VIRLAATLAFVARVALALSAIVEGREGIGAITLQMQAPGSPTQYAHNEATCAACAAQALHGAGPALAVVLPPPELPARVAIAATPFVPSLSHTPNLFSRAPPPVI
jgi:hypothetical protein